MKLAQCSFLDPAGGTSQLEECLQSLLRCHSRQDGILVLVRLHHKNRIAERFWRLKQHPRADASKTVRILPPAALEARRGNGENDSGGTHFILLCTHQPGVARIWHRAVALTVLVRRLSRPRPAPNSRNVSSERRSGADTKPSLLRISVPSARRSLPAKAAPAERVVQLSTLDASARSYNRRTETRGC